MSRAGDSCAESDDLDLLMINVLQDMRNALGEAEAEVRVVVEIDAEDQTYAIPDVIGKVTEVYDAFGRSLQPGGRRPSWDEDETTGRVEFYEVLGTNIVLHPIPSEDTSIEIRGFATLDSTLYEVVSNVRVWNTIPLPVEIHTMYYKWVLGLSILDRDPARGTMWINLAEQEFNRWREYQTTSRARMIMNGAPLYIRRRRRLDDVSRFKLEP